MKITLTFRPCLLLERTSGAAAITGILSGFLLPVASNNYVPGWFGHETWLYTAFPDGHGGYEIPFLICMGLPSGFTILLVLVISLLSPATHSKAFDLRKISLRLEPAAIGLLVVTVLLLTALDVKFW